MRSGYFGQILKLFKKVLFRKVGRVEWQEICIYTVYLDVLVTDDKLITCPQFCRNSPCCSDQR
jgi:hypothetical protein